MCVRVSVKHKIRCCFCRYDRSVALLAVAAVAIAVAAAGVADAATITLRRGCEVDATVLRFLMVLSSATAAAVVVADATTATATTAANSRARLRREQGFEWARSLSVEEVCHGGGGAVLRSC